MTFPLVMAVFGSCICGVNEAEHMEVVADVGFSFRGLNYIFLMDFSIKTFRKWSLVYNQ